jgi:hypothetical protein
LSTLETLRVVPVLFAGGVAVVYLEGALDNIMTAAAGVFFGLERFKDVVGGFIEEFLFGCHRDSIL